MSTQNKQTQVKNASWLAMALIVANSLTAQFVSAPNRSNGSQSSLAAFPLANEFHASVFKADSVSMRFTAKVSNPEKASFTVEIVSSTGDRFFTQTFTAEQYEQTYNFSSAPDGYYSIKIFKGKQKIIKKIRIFTDTYTERKTEML